MYWLSFEAPLKRKNKSKTDAKNVDKKSGKFF